ncbi:MAG: NUDIX hydrolase [Erysipelotrichaceae bacterium]|nr:NUDIX hydrolase [Erysipelotrichaceae bacterium]
MDQKERILPTHIVAAAGIVLNETGEILLVRDNRSGWVYPGGQVEVGENIIDALKREIREETGVEVEVGEVFCISSNTCKYPGYNGVREVPTKVAFDFICRYKSGTPRGSDENSESVFVPSEKVPGMITSPAIIERYKTYLNYSGRPAYLEYVTRPVYELKLKTLI